METNKVRIVAAVVDQQNLVLYKENGETIKIPQGDMRIRKIITDATPSLIEYGYADVDMSMENLYTKFEEQSNGVVKLFRIAKEKLKEFFSTSAEPLAPLSIGTVPETTAVAKALNAVEEILQHATPVTSPEFTEDNITKQGNIVDGNHTVSTPTESRDTHTIVAQVGDKLIPGMELIKSQLVRAGKMGSTTGIENFLKRLGTVINERRHSVDDLLKFLERADLPIADDGCILIYKLLERKNKNYVDVHTKRVEQWVGAYVCMDPSLVDHNRATECSNGLHVARRGYLGSFGGDVCVLAKLAPEDVIAVPHRDANKMRVCGYHIIKELSQEQMSLLKNNRPLTDTQLLTDAIAGNHIAKTHEVRIHGQQGHDIKVTVLQNVAQSSTAKPKQQATPLENPEKENIIPPVELKEVAQVVQFASRKEQVKNLFDAYKSGDPEALQKLLDIKKAAKVSWEKLGIVDPSTVKVKKPNPQTVTNKEFVKLATTVAQEAQVSEGSARERIAKLIAIGIKGNGIAVSIMNIKKQAKKSWSALGVDDKTAEKIMKLSQG